MAEYNQLTSVTLPNLSGLTVPLENFSQQNPQPGYSQVAWYLDPQAALPPLTPSPLRSDPVQQAHCQPVHHPISPPTAALAPCLPLSAQWDSAVKLTPNGFSRPGYTFSHWSTQPQKDATTYQNEQEVENLAGEKNNGERVTLSPTSTPWCSTPTAAPETTCPWRPPTASPSP